MTIRLEPYPGGAGCQGADFTQGVVDHHLYPSTDLDPIITDPEFISTTDPGPRTEYAVFVHIDSPQLQLCSLSNTEISHRMKTDDTYGRYSAFIKIYSTTFYIRSRINTSFFPFVHIERKLQIKKRKLIRPNPAALFLFMLFS